MTKRVTRVGRAWGVAVRESFSSVVAYVVEASVREGRAVLHRVTAGVHCNLAVNPRTVEAQVQGAAVMGLSMCLPGSAITLKDGEVQQSNFGDFTVARMTDMPAFDVHVVPSADAPTGTGELGLPPLAPAFANAVARLTGKPLRQCPSTWRDPAPCKISTPWCCTSDSGHRATNTTRRSVPPNVAVQRRARGEPLASPARASARTATAR